MTSLLLSYSVGELGNHSWVSSGIGALINKDIRTIGGVVLIGNNQLSE